MSASDALLSKAGNYVTSWLPGSLQPLVTTSVFTKQGIVRTKRDAIDFARAAFAKALQETQDAKFRSLYAQYLASAESYYAGSVWNVVGIIKDVVARISSGTKSTAAWAKSVAKEYWMNVENAAASNATKAAGGSSFPPSPPSTALAVQTAQPPAAQPDPFYKQAWFPPAVILGLVLVGGGAFLATRKN